MIEPEVKEKIIRLITALLPDAKIYLFGSQATGEARHYSDIDIAIDAGKPLPNVVTYEIKSVLEAAHILYKFDIVDFNKVGNDMKESILRERVIWKN